MIRRNYGLDVLRTLAILLVLVSHALFFVIQAYPQSDKVKLISYFCGFWGVELFFILSGFLIGKIIKDQVFNTDQWLITFWIRRWFRTIPCYILFMIFNILWFYYQQKHLPESLLSYWFFAQNLAWKHPDFFPEAWSLAIEEHFYLIFPVLIILLARIGFKSGTAYLISGGFLWLLSTLLRLIWVSVEPSLTWDADIRKVVIFRFDSLIYGIYLSFFIDRIRDTRQIRLLLFIGLIFLCGSILTYFHFDHDHSWFLKTFGFSITSLGFMLTIPYMLNFRFSESNFIGDFFRKTAQWSYSIYLSNFLIYMMIRELIFSKYFAEDMRQGVLLCVMLLVVGCYLISAIVYRLYELPLMNLREPAIRWKAAW